MERRSFLAAIAAIIVSAGCALRGTPNPNLASIQGHVFHRGIRFGRTTEKNPTGQYDTTAVVPGVFVSLSTWQYTQTGWAMVHMERQRTTKYGSFEFANIQGGDHMISVDGYKGKSVSVHVHVNKPYIVALWS